jgi:lipoprotein NlpI
MYLDSFVHFSYSSISQTMAVVSSRIARKAPERPWIQIYSMSVLRACVVCLSNNTQLVRKDNSLMAPAKPGLAREAGATNTSQVPEQRHLERQEKRGQQH